MKKTAAVAIAVLTIVSRVGTAGECTRSTEYYLEALAADSCESAMRCLSCVGLPSKVHVRWGIAAEKKYLTAMRELPYAERLITIAKGRLQDPTTCEVAALVLAFQGISRVDSVDVFEMLTERENFPFSWLRWYALASLQDSRTIEYAKAKYYAIHASERAITPDIRDSLKEIIDCLFHFPTKESRTLLAKVASKETDGELREYMKRTAGV